jgi:hypothetical protein
VPVDDQGQRSFAKGASSAYGTGQQLRSSGQRDLAIETDAHFTRNVSYDPPVVIISARSALKLEVLCRRFSLVRDFLVFDDLPLIETAEASGKDRNGKARQGRQIDDPRDFPRRTVTL